MTTHTLPMTQAEYVEMLRGFAVLGLRRVFRVQDAFIRASFRHVDGRTVMVERDNAHYAVTFAGGAA